MNLAKRFIWVQSYIFLFEFEQFNCYSYNFILLVSINKARLTKCKHSHKFLSNKNTAEMCVFKNTDNFMEFILIMSNIKEKLAEAPSLVLVATL